MMWSNDRIPLVTGGAITEYDIVRGNTSIMRTFKLKAPGIIKSLEQMPKKERVVAVGKLMREDAMFARNLERGFDLAVEEFVTQNHLDRDVDILEIRRDAVFVLNRDVMLTEFHNRDIIFMKRNMYTHMIRLAHGITVFILENGTEPIYRLDGLIRPGPDRDVLIQKLKPGPLSLLHEFMLVKLGSGNNRKRTFKWANDVAESYKKRLLDPEYYREFNREASFRIGDTLFDNVDEAMIDDLDISYNYTHIIMPLLEILV